MALLRRPNAAIPHSYRENQNLTEALESFKSAKGYVKDSFAHLLAVAEQECPEIAALIAQAGPDDISFDVILTINAGDQ